MSKLWLTLQFGAVILTQRLTVGNSPKCPSIQTWHSATEHLQSNKQGHKIQKESAGVMCAVKNSDQATYMLKLQF